VVSESETKGQNVVCKHNIVTFVTFQTFSRNYNLTSKFLSGPTFAQIAFLCSVDREPS